MIYLDHAATTPILPEVREAMLAAMDTAWANPGAGSHQPGAVAAEYVSEQRHQLADLLGIDAAEIVFTGSATEANNLAIMGYFAYGKRHSFLTAATEHSAVLACVAPLKAMGVECTILPVDTTGKLDLNQLESALKAGVDLVSLMWVNNETGARHPISVVAELCQRHGADLHVDAVQAPKCTPIVLHQGISFLTLSAHKCGGPKGVGMLYRRQRPPTRLAPILHGGAQERGLRPGTEAPHQIAGLATALGVALSKQPLFTDSARQWRTQFVEALSAVDGITCHEALDQSPHILSVLFDGVNGESLLFALPELALASGSACTSNAMEPSHVIRAMGRDRQQAQSTLRISMGEGISSEVVIDATSQILEAYQSLRAKSNGL
ncbi:MAG: cysteine desulfurase [Gammaproteobacteria bacterium]|nr:cysteine desulfurase [Gammaproteobacteria bacterium]